MRKHCRESRTRGCQSRLGDGADLNGDPSLARHLDWAPHNHELMVTMIGVATDIPGSFCYLEINKPNLLSAQITEVGADSPGEKGRLQEYQQVVPVSARFLGFCTSTKRHRCGKTHTRHRITSATSVSFDFDSRMTILYRCGDWL